MAPEPRIIDLTNLPAPAGPGAPASPAAAPHPATQDPTPPDERHAHLLRLALDLQLDAMLLTLGAAAAHDVAVDSAPGGPLWAHGDDSVPWRRWLAEDVDVTRSLTSTALALDAALPPTLGAGPSHTDAATTAEDLLARYESMCAMLEDLLEREHAGLGVTWYPHVRQAYVRCRGRVLELRRHRAGLVAAAGPGEDHHYLPGELLG